jgi:hypothetical protein
LVSGARNEASGLFEKAFEFYKSKFMVSYDMHRNSFSLRLVATALMFFVGLLAGLAQSGQPWPRGSQEILKLERANVSDDVIIAYIRNSNLHYKLNPSEIVMLKQQGFSDRVLEAMQEPPPPPAQPPYRVQPPPVLTSRPHNPFPFYLFPSVSLGYGSGGNWYGGVGLNGGWHN